MPSFWSNPLVILVLDFVVHFDIFCRRLLAVFRRNIESCCPCVKTPEFFYVRFIVVGRVAPCGFESQVFDHPDLISDLDSVVGLAITRVHERSVVEHSDIFDKAVFMGNSVFFIGGFLCTNFVDVFSHAIT